MESENSYTIKLVLNLERLSNPFWMSLFIPSICLIIAAEIALFIDESHFEAMIMVSLTSNLVMYTLYSGIQEKMPANSSFKFIDMWLLHGLVMPMVVFVVLATNQMMNEKKPDAAPLVKNIKVASTSATTIKKSKEFEVSGVKKGKHCMFIFKIAIPTFSLIFVVIFFATCLSY